MKFPILIQFPNKKTKIRVDSYGELPFDTYFKIVRTNITPPEEDIILEGEYTVLNEVPKEEMNNSDEPPQENNESPVAIGEGNGAGISS